MKRIVLIFTLITLFSGVSFSQLKSFNEDSPARHIRYFPNPAITTINFEFLTSFNKYSTLEIYNFIGRKVYDIRISIPKITIPLTDFYRGVYIYQLRDRSGKILESGKFQVTK